MIKNLGLIFILLILGISCQRSDSPPDVSNLDLTLKVTRFEQLLFAVDTNNLEAEIDQLTAEHPGFGDVFFFQIIGIPGGPETVTDNVRYFLQDSLINDLYQITQNDFSDFSSYETSLKTSLKYFKYYFPDKPIPDVYTCMSGFEVGAFTVGDNILGIGLDFYLGPGFKYYDPSLFPEYIQATMDHQYLVAKSMQALVANYVGETSGNRLLDYMIRNGIEIYIKEKLLPWAEDEIVHEFSTEQLIWLRNNETEIWAFLLDQDLLYSNEYRKFQKLISPSPNVPNMPPEAPGRVGNWIGYKIVSAYMDRYPDMSLEQLFDQKDAQQILTDSRFKPGQSY